MDPALLQEREQFKKKAASIPAVEKRQNTTPLDDQGGSKKRKLNPPSNIKHQNLAALAKIVQYLRKNYLGGDSKPVTLEKILEETKQSNINSGVKSWLFEDALINNPRITFVENKFIFKPIYKLETGKSLVSLLKKHQLHGLGGILWDDVIESLPNAETILTRCENRNLMTTITRSSDKKKVIFFRDKNSILEIDEDLKRKWNTLAVDALGNDQVSNYLEEQGISSIKGKEIKRAIASEKSSTRQRKSRKPKDNAHLADVLETYEDRPKGG